MNDMNLEWDDIIGNDHIRGFLKDIIEKDMVSHAYLFEGIEGIGKKLTAKVFARYLNNKTRYSPAIIEPIGKQILIEQIRNIKRQFNLKNADSITRILIIDEIDKLNTESGNSLLKLIEEPPAKSVIIGITSEYENVLPTIVSRMQRITFNPLKFEDVIKILNRNGAGNETAELLWGLFPGSAGRPYFWTVNPQIFTVYENVADMFFRAGTENIFNPVDEADKLYALVNEFARSMKSDYEAQAERLSDFIGKKNAKQGIKQLEELRKREVAKNVDEILNDIFCIIASFCRDIIFIKSGAEILNKAFTENINTYSEHNDMKHVIEILNFVETTSRDLQYNVERKLILETLLFKIREVKHARSY